MLTEVSGRFVRIAFADDPGIHLSQGRSDRPAARFNRLGQDALYLSPDEASARVAIGEYVRNGDPARVLLTFDVSRCHLFDLRHPMAKSVYELARQPWKVAFQNGEVPVSWYAADKIRQNGHVGLIDPSRQKPGLWHITLFRWNMPGSPTVRHVGTPVPIRVEPKNRSLD